MPFRSLRLVLAVLLTIVLTNFVSAENNDEYPDKTTGAKITYCHDGDTCRIVTDSGLWFNARLAGIDAPEVESKRKGQGQPLGDQSRDTLSELVTKKKNIEIRQVDLDHYNRPVIEIYADKECLNLKLLELGLAERYSGKTKRIDRSKYDAAEEKAKAQKLGIWGQKNYVSPQQFRREGKK